jgi:MFS family permease
MAAGPEAANPHRLTREERRVIAASSAGTVFEWYDFYLYGALAPVIAATFFAGSPEGLREVFALLAFASGFLVRPLGALFFGRLGDLVGRKYAFLLAVLLMGGATFAVGLLPGPATIGGAAPALLVALRLVQGFALGGAYGGAATMVAEYAPRHRRGFATGFVQMTASGGLLLALLVVLALRGALGEAAFADWGWRIAFLLSIVLLAISVWIRMEIEESPAFRAMKAAGTHARRPLREAFAQWANLRLGLVALFGLVAGQAVVWYTGQFYALFFLGAVLGVDGTTASLLLAWALLLGGGGFVLFGALSDRIGRKPVILGGCLLAALAYQPLFRALSAEANPALDRAHRSIEVVLRADPADCTFQFDPIGTARFTRGCDIARAALAQDSVAWRVEAAPPGSTAEIRIGATTVPSDRANLEPALRAALDAAGYPRAANPTTVRMAHPFDLGSARTLAVIGILLLLVLPVTMVYGPIAAALTELFPTRIRYSAVSLPYHLGNGWFGGLLPATSFAMIAQTGDVYWGLWYPIAVAAATAAIGMVFVPESRGRDMRGDERSGAPLR